MESNLNARQQLFVIEFMKDLNATQAAIRAGYSAHTANEMGAENLAKPSIRLAIAEAVANRKERIQVDADFVLRELVALASVDLAAAYDENGNLKDIHDIPIEVRKAIAGVEVFEEYQGTGAEREYIGQTKKLKLWDRPKALEMLGRHLALFNDKLQISGSVTIESRLAAGRRRSAAG